MGVFEQFPYSNFHDLNLDWILNEIKSFAGRLDGYEGDLADMQQQLNRFPEEFTEEFTQVIYRILNEEWGDLLPAVTVDDDGMVLGVVAGEWNKVDIPDGNLPPVSDVDAGKVLRVSSAGGWSASGMDDFTGDYKVIDMFTKYLGIITSLGAWSYTTNSGYRHIVIPVQGGESLYIKATNRATYYAAITAHDLPLTGSVSFSSATGWTSRRSLASGGRVYDTIPSDARYLFVQTRTSNNDCTPVSITVDGYDIIAASVAGGLVDFLKSYTDSVTGGIINVFNNYGISAPLKWEPGTIKTSDGIGNPITLQDSTTRMRTGAFLTLVDLEIVHSDDYIVQVVYVDSDSPSAVLVALDPAQISNRYPTIPAGSRFRLLGGHADGTAMTETPGDMDVAIRALYTGIAEELYPRLVEWECLGDSIAQGYYSYLDENNQPASALDTGIAWPVLAAKYNKWSLDNLAVGGTGFLDPHGSENITGWKIARDHTFSGNLVTIAYGINDWKGNQPLGEILSTIPSTPTTVIGAAQYIINKILTDNPECKIIGILPLNDADYGDFSSNWAINTQNGNGVTLGEFSAAIKAVYEYYGIEVIDLTHSSVVNRLNIQSLLIDGVHPSIEAHRLLALELSERISFKS